MSLSETCQTDPMAVPLSEQDDFRDELSAFHRPMFHPAQNSGPAPSAKLAALLFAVYSGDGRHETTRRELMAHFGYVKLGPRNQDMIVACLAERGIALPTAWHEQGMDEMVLLTKMPPYVAPREVGTRLRAELGMLVAATMRIRYRDLLFLHGFARNNAAARDAISETLRLADLDISPPAGDAAPQH